MCAVGLSFWGGVHPETGVILDSHHPQQGESVAGKFLMMPSSRGSCTGSAVLLGLALSGKAPAALIFREPEDILTLGALVANSLYNASIAVIRLDQNHYEVLACGSTATLADGKLEADSGSIELSAIDDQCLSLSETDRAILEGGEGPALQIAMQTICTIGLIHGAKQLIDISRAHIDGCIYACEANLTFAQTMQTMGARVQVPTTMNAISVDHGNWRKQGVAQDFGIAASRLADAYVEMGALPTFTCAPYLSDERPNVGETIGWSESNAVIYANSVLGARTNKHPDFFDLFIAMTGRVPEVGVYCQIERQPAMTIDVELPAGADESVWPLIGWIAGNLACDKIPLLTGLAEHAPDTDDLKALCAAFGTTSGAPMLHIQEITPESDQYLANELPSQTIGPLDILCAWQSFNNLQTPVNLIALGSPHLSISECQSFAALMQGRKVGNDIHVILTVGRDTLQSIQSNGVLTQLLDAGAQVVPDVCWCSISRPLFPVNTRSVMTNSAKYAHYGPALSDCDVVFGSLRECANTAVTGSAPEQPPAWLAHDV